MCSGCRFHRTFPNEVDMETIVRAWCATVNNSRPHEDLNVRLYRPTFVNELSDGDKDRHYESCHALLDTFSNAVSRSKVLFSDECAIYCSSRDRNVVFWSKENPNFTQELEHNPPHVIWAGMTSDYLIGPYFF